MTRHLSPTPTGKWPRRTVAFTLAEMLVVMAIIAVLLAATLPAMRGLGGSANRHGAVDTLLGVLDRARMMAVSDGLATYVVFAVPTDTSNGMTLKPDLRGRAYAIYQDHDNVLFKPEQKTPWLQLPNTLAFKKNAGDGTFGTVTNQPLAAGTDPQFPVSAGAMPAGTTPPAAGVLLPYWKFDPSGGVMIPSYANLDNNKYFRLLIFPGYLDAASGGEVPTQNPNGTKGNTTGTLLEEVDVNLATGRARYVVNPNNNLAAATPTPST